MSHLLTPSLLDTSCLLFILLVFFYRAPGEPWILLLWYWVMSRASQSFCDVHGRSFFFNLHREEFFLLSTRFFPYNLNNCKEVVNDRSTCSETSVFLGLHITILALNSHFYKFHIFLIWCKGLLILNNYRRCLFICNCNLWCFPLSHYTLSINIFLVKTS